MSTAPAFKPDFAKRPVRFANGARVARTGALALVAAFAAVLVGAFGTHTLPLPARTLFWIGLIGWNWLKWEALFAVLMPRLFGWRTVLALGFLVSALTIPFEVRFAAGLAGSTQTASAGAILLRVAGLNLLLGGCILVVLPWLRRANVAPPVAHSSETVPRFPGTAIRLEEIAALLAQDHYVCLRLADGSQRLLHHRFGDAMATMAEVAGEQVHRGAWIADRHRGEAVRQGNRWTITAGGIAIPVSRNRVATLRALGWLSRRGG